MNSTEPTLYTNLVRQAERIDQMLRRLQWTVLRPLAARIGGDERSLFLGAGIEVDELREYQPGDDVRLMDWNLSARAGRPFIRQSHVSRALDVCLALDLSASVDWGTAECLKRDRAAELAAVTAQIFLRHGHRVGLFLFADQPVGVIPPGAGSQYLLRLLHAVQQQPSQVRRGPTDLVQALTRLDRTLPRRSLLILVSDFLVPSGWQKMMRQMVQRHEIVAVRLSDPRELELPDVGLITFEDPETGSQMVVDTSSSSLRQRFAQAAAAQHRQAAADLSASGVDLLELSTAAPLLPALVRFLEKRRRQAALVNRGQAGQRASRSAGGQGEPV
jgi:uncharacterized protein (DUF58 family)